MKAGSGFSLCHAVVPSNLFPQLIRTLEILQCLMARAELTRWDPARVDIYLALKFSLEMLNNWEHIWAAVLGSLPHPHLAASSCPSPFPPLSWRCSLWSAGTRVCVANLHPAGETSWLKWFSIFGNQTVWSALSESFGHEQITHSFILCEISVLVNGYISVIIIAVVVVGKWLHLCNNNSNTWRSLFSNFCPPSPKWNGNTHFVQNHKKRYYFNLSFQFVHTRKTKQELAFDTISSLDKRC